MSAGKTWDTIWWGVFIGGSLVIGMLGLAMYRSRLEIGSKGARSLGQWIWWITVGIIGWLVTLLFFRSPY